MVSEAETVDEDADTVENDGGGGAAPARGTKGVAVA